MSKMTLTQIMSMQTAFVKMRQKLADAGVDVSDVKCITDLPWAAAGIMPAGIIETAVQNPNVREMVQLIMGDQNLVPIMQETMGLLAQLGQLSSQIDIPTSVIGKGDLTNG